MDDDGNSYVTFGDGRTGARLPTGDSNVTAVYRRGIGTAGHARIGQITQPMNKPHGVKGVTNPQKAVGGGDWQTLADARTNASLTALTLGRVVSLRDYEDFALAYPAIGKASATWSWSGEQRHILLTIAGDGGTRVEEDSDLAKRLLSAVRKLGDPRVALTIVPHDALLFFLKAKVKVDPRYLRDKVFGEIRTRLRDAFSFDTRSFGQAVSRAEIVSVMHAGQGVIAVDLDELYSSEGSASDDVQRIGAEPRTKNGPARILTLDTASEVRLEVMP
jgi:predicted phage baseplate assembly protein